VLRSGWVIVGSLPTRNGSISGPGCLIVLDSHGTVRETFAGHGINGPWDMAAVDYGNSAVLFVTNVLNGTVEAGGKTVHGGTVLRIGLAVPSHGLPWVTSHTVIGSGFPEALNSSALVLGPTGAGLGSNDTLYVADTLANRVAGIRDALFRGSDAGTGFTLSQGGHLNSELGLVIAPNGNILTVNGGDGNLIEITPSGHQVTVRQLVKNGAGALFGLAVQPHRDALYFVNDDATPCSYSTSTHDGTRERDHRRAEARARAFSKSEGSADQDGLGAQFDAEGGLHAVADLAGQGQQRGGGAVAVVD
jgi:hypothetical protein